MSNNQGDPKQNALGENIKGENINQLGQITYDDFTKSELIKYLKSKDKIISDLKQTLKHQKKMEKDQINHYRMQIEQHLINNQKAVKSFQSITQTVVQIIKKYQYIDTATRQTVKNVVEGIRETHGRPFKEEEQEQEQVSQFSCFQQIVTQTSKLLQYLERLTNQNVNIVVRLKEQLAHTKDELAKAYKFESNLKNDPNDQIRNLNEEVNKLVVENKNLASLLQQNQAEKKKILTSINTILTEEMITQLIKVPTNELIEQIRRQTYRIRQLQRDKQQIYRKSKAEKESNQKNFHQLLSEVKEIRKVNHISSPKI